MIQSNRLRLQTLTCSAKIDASRFRTKRYTHFDNKISINRVINDITNPCWVTKHGFYPFIHFKIEFFKYNKEKKKENLKHEIYITLHILIVIFTNIMEIN